MIVTLNYEFTKLRQIASNEGKNIYGLPIHIANIKSGFKGIRQHCNREKMQEEHCKYYLRYNSRKIRANLICVISIQVKFW